jgi:hypothetical protein
MRVSKEFSSRKRFSAKRHSTKKRSVKKTPTKKDSVKKDSVKKDSVKKSSVKKSSVKKQISSQYKMRGMGILLNMYGGASDDLERQILQKKRELEDLKTELSKERSRERREKIKAAIIEARRQIAEDREKLKQLLKGVSDSAYRAASSLGSKLKQLSSGIKKEAKGIRESDELQKIFSKKFDDLKLTKTKREISVQTESDTASETEKKNEEDEKKLEKKIQDKLEDKIEDKIQDKIQDNLEDKLLPPYKSKTESIKNESDAESSDFFNLKSDEKSNEQPAIQDPIEEPLPVYKSKESQVGGNVEDEKEEDEENGNVVVRLNKKYVGIYCPFDSYPDYIGNRLVALLRAHKPERSEEYRDYVLKSFKRPGYKKIKSSYLSTFKDVKWLYLVDLDNDTFKVMSESDKVSHDLKKIPKDWAKTFEEPEKPLEEPEYIDW